MTQNNATRLLEAKAVHFQVHEVPAVKLSALDISSLLSVSPDRVFKTIVVKRVAGKSILALVPGNCEVNLKLLAKIVDEKKLTIASQDEAERLTSLKTGGISPLLLINKGFTIVIDEACHQHEDIIISGGQRGLMISLQPNDLIRLTSARVGKICQTI